MRLYTFTNMYTEGIHAGIQSLHVLGELVNKYPRNHLLGADPAKDQATNVLYDWLENHKTVYVYDGGLASMLWDRYQELRECANALKLPIARFYESKEALNGALTCVGIVVPDQYYRNEPVQTTPSIGGDMPPLFSPEQRLRTLLTNCKRAR
jgi:hypothetical protein